MELIIPQELNFHWSEKWKICKLTDCLSECWLGTSYVYLWKCQIFFSCSLCMSSCRNSKIVRNVHQFQYITKIEVGRKSFFLSTRDLIIQESRWFHLSLYISEISDYLIGVDSKILMKSSANKYISSTILQLFITYLCCLHQGISILEWNIAVKFKKSWGIRAVVLKLQKIGASQDVETSAIKKKK